MTNRELYVAIEELTDRHNTSNRSLEQYLSALLNSARCQPIRDTWTPEDFLQVLADSYVADPVSFDEGWRTGYQELDTDAPGFAGWEATLIRQIVDLREMDETGLLKNENKSFGTSAPQGGTWYNFEPAMFLECGMQGSFGGWAPSESSSRILVDEEEDEDEYEADEVIEVPAISWDEFQQFLYCGQAYE